MIFVGQLCWRSIPFVLLLLLLSKDRASAQKPCGESVALERAFNDSADLKVLITEFIPADTTPASESAASSLATALLHSFPAFVRSIIDNDARRAGITTDRIAIANVNCQAISHDDARKIGERVGAHLVLWGVAQSTIERDSKQLIREFREAAKKINIASHNVINAPDAAKVSIKATVNFRVKAPAAGVTFRTSMTAVSWRGVEADGSGANAGGVLTQDFPALATGEPTALFYLVLGEYAFERGRYALAARMFESTSETVFADGSRVADIYRDIARAYTFARELKRAKDYSDKAIQSCAAEDQSCKALNTNNKGWTLKEAGEKESAKRAYEEALRLSQAARDDYVYATALNNLSSLSSRPEETIELLLKALPIRQKIGDLVGEGSTLHNLGAAYYALGDTEEALRYYNQAADKRVQANDVPGEAATARALATLRLSLGDAEGSFVAANQAVQAAELVGDIPRSMNSVLLLHEAAMRLGREDAINSAISTFLELARKHAKSLKELTDPYLANNVGFMFYRAQRYDNAILFYRRAMALFTAQGDVSGHALGYSNVGKAMFYQKRYREALMQFKLGLPMMRQARSIYLPNLLHNMGMAYAALDQRDEALMSYREAIDLRRVNKDKFGLADSLEGSADVLCARNENEEAAATYLEAARQYPATQRKYRELVNRALELAQTAGSSEILEKAREMLRSLDN